MVAWLVLSLTPAVSYERSGYLWQPKAPATRIDPARDSSGQIAGTKPLPKPARQDIEVAPVNDNNLLYEWLPYIIVAILTLLSALIAHREMVLRDLVATAKDTLPQWAYSQMVDAMERGFKLAAAGTATTKTPLDDIALAELKKIVLEIMRSPQTIDRAIYSSPDGMVDILYNDEPAFPLDANQVAPGMPPVDMTGAVG